MNSITKVQFVDAMTYISSKLSAASEMGASKGIASAKKG
jgi:hypothetical protein